MDADYIDQKIEEILIFTKADVLPDVDYKKKFLKFILEAVWLTGKIEGVQEAKKIL